ncbi:MAG: molybdenum cofactor guanylyltransferase [Planctomycetota bacterium]|nr:molybdenum cofactor guanylyltransferase [Planctomycetota bacterium]
MKQFESAYILAGGQSRRFGKNKALVSISGEPLIVRLASQLASEGHEVTLVVQKATDYSAYGIPLIEDGVDHAGPLAGVLAALRASSGCGDKWCLISSCDILDWRKEWFPVLKAAVESKAGARTAIFLGQEPQDFSPFPGLYHSMLLGLAEELWSEGVRSMREFHRRIESHGEVEKCPLRPDLLPKTFNTQSELGLLLGERSVD